MGWFANGFLRNDKTAQRLNGNTVLKAIDEVHAKIFRSII